MNSNLALFLTFMQRDIYVYAKRIRFYIINYLLLYPLIYVLSFAYLAPRTFMLADNTAVLTISLLSGNLLLIILNLAFNLLSPILFDRENTRFIDYQIRHMHPWLFITQQLLFTTLFTFLLVIPFFPISKLLLGQNLDLTQTSWPLLFAMLLCSSLCCNAYTMLAIWVMSKIQQIKILWVRISIPLFVLGGFWAPWHIIHKTSHLLGYAMLLNPFMYVTEGLRSSITGSPEYFSAWLCMAMLLLFSALFFGLSLYFFKKRMDPVL